MESRRMVVMNLFAGSRGDVDTENRLMDTEGGSGEERVGQTERATWKLTRHQVDTRQPVGICRVAQGTQAGWEVGGRLKRAQTYVTYGRSMWMDGGNQHGIVIILRLKIKIKKKFFLKRWYRWAYLQNRKRLTDLENKVVATKGERWWGGIN